MDRNKYLARMAYEGLKEIDQPRHGPGAQVLWASQLVQRLAQGDGGDEVWLAAAVYALRQLSVPHAGSPDAPPDQVADDRRVLINAKDAEGRDAIVAITAREAKERQAEAWQRARASSQDVGAERNKPKDYKPEAPDPEGHFGCALCGERKPDAEIHPQWQGAADLCRPCGEQIDALEAPARKARYEQIARNRSKAQ